MKGLFAWIGFNQTAIIYDRSPRFAGSTKWNYWRLWNFAIEGITSFTIAPLKLATYAGLLTALIAFAYGIFIVAHTLLHSREMPGYPSLMVVILFVAGVQLTAMGIMGEYIGRIFMEAKGRPLYLLNAYLKADGVDFSLRPVTTQPTLKETRTSGTLDKAALNTAALHRPETKMNHGQTV
jgi:glycosyltransferase involved in cell wall biosynthesis